MDASLFPPMALDSPPVLLLVSVPPTGLKAGTSPVAVMAAISLVWVFMCVLWLLLRRRSCMKSPCEATFHPCMPISTTAPEGKGQPPWHATQVSQPESWQTFTQAPQGNERG